jgi:hypothetical protein
MGRLPVEFAGKEITFRIPYSMPGEMQLEADSQGVQFPEATFLHNVEKCFEIHRVLVRLTALDDSTPPVILTTQPTILDKLTRLRITDTSKNEVLTKNAQLVDSMLKDNERTWEWEDPYTLVRSEGFQVAVDTEAGYPAGTEVIRVEITFQGYLIVIGAPGESR